MKKMTVVTFFVMAIACFSSPGAMAQEPIKFGAIYDFAGGCHM